MRLDVLLLPRELPVRSRPEPTAVVVDVLRATTSIVTAFQHGCRSVLPVVSLEEAQRARRRTPDAILAGEQGGLRIPGFDFGNSPREFTREAVGGRDVILTTSNGTKTLRAVGGGRRVAIGAFLNRSAVGDWMAAREADSLVVCAGYGGGLSLEDAVCAGAIVDRAASVATRLVLGDGARACRVLWERFGTDLLRLLPETAWGRRMLAMGFGPDMEVCARVDVTDVVPTMEGGRITLGQRAAG
ncbi:MAG: 2-phosphosulfolactate phosphatase [Candidatus Methylomirabilales bacterium]